MTPTAQVVSLLKQNTSKLEGLKKEHIHAYMISPQDKTKTDAILVVSEAPGGRHGYGNGVPIFERRRLQLDFYYPPNYEQDMEAIEQKVRAFLFAHSFRCYANAGHVMTPDNKNITNTLKFNYTIQM
ncbi:hypothetical protein [uncultured Lactobacillus sp.]|uniref:hypothetical protein n=1 Tax=uncultured Lactobacillus sp. TaxID=153152 RepID=UPI002628A771|nr:hypothetical protein [uncultured Lactobacillus sp.]